MENEKKVSTLEIFVHPLVVLSIADHITRDKIQTKKGRVIGVLFGKQVSRQVDILETLEVNFDQIKDEVKVDFENFEVDHKLFVEAYPGYELLGWYSLGKKPFPSDREIHDQMKEYNNFPLYMMVDEKVEEEARDLPIKMYQEQTSIADDGKATIGFGLTPYEIRADESEQITVVHCASAGNEDEGSSVRSHYAALARAVKMLNERIKVIHQYLEDVQSKSLPVDHSILRDIKGLTGLLPTMDSPEFSEDFLNEYNDALLLTYLSSVTKGCNVVSDIVEKFNVTFSNSGVGGGRMHRGIGISGMGGAMANILGGFGGMSTVM